MPAAAVRLLDRFRTHASRAIAGVGVAGIIGCTPSAERGSVSIGAPAPAYRAVRLGGDSASLGALRGKVVMLNIWATWCAPCRDEIPVLETLHQQYGGDGLEIVGVSVDARGEEKRIGEFASRIGMTYPIWHDPDERVSSLYQAIGVPATYLIDREGILRWRRLGPIAGDDTTFMRGLSETLRSRPGEPEVPSVR